jgi:hypothetical protein
MATIGYTGLDAANRGENAAPEKLSGYGSVSMRSLVESSLGRPIDDNFYNQDNPQYAENMATMSRASNALYGDVGANIDARDWNAIMSTDNPLKAAEDALKAMYSDKDYLVANTDHVLAQGYLPEQADYTYQQMASRVGSTYNPNWTEGSKFSGKVDTATYLNNLNTMDADALAEYVSSRWKQWGGDPTSRGLADITNSANSVFDANAAKNAGAFTPVGATGSPTTGTPPTNTATSSGSTTGTPPTNTGLATGSAAGSVTGSPTTGTGLISGADNLSGFRAMTPSQTNSAGLITSSMLTTPKSPSISLPSGPTTPQTAPTNTWNFGSAQAAGAPQVQPGVVTWTNPATGQRATYPVGAPSPGAGWIMG